MEEKKVIVTDGNYTCDIDISVEEWKNILQDETLMLNNYKEALSKFYNEPEHKSTCKALGEKYNKSPHHYNGSITNFAVAVQRKLKRFNVVHTDGSKTYWVIPMTGKHVGRHFEWTMRPELVQAIEEIGINTLMKNMNDDFDWIPFYMELADKILQYKSKRDDLIAFIFNKLKPKFTGYLKKTDNIDPFTFIGIFNRGMTDENRLLLAKEFKSFFNITSEVPTSLAGIPILHNMKACFFPLDYRKGTNDIENLWTLFEQVLQDDIYNNDFYSIFDTVKEQYMVNRNITMGLFWIRPYKFLSLDNTNTNYLEEKYGIKCSLKMPEAKEYLNFISEIKSKMEINEIKEKSFPEFSRQAWLYKKDDDMEIEDENNYDDPIVNLLKSSKNLILTGAPGVGKTYKTAEIAVAIADGKTPTNRSDLMKRYKELINSEQIAFTTFHQSLDYEEFVEGLKPEIDDDDNSTGNFRVKKGIFKDICDNAKDTESVETIDDFTLNGFEKYLQTINVKYTATRNKYLKRIKVLLGNETMKTSKCRQEDIPKYTSLQDIVANEAAVIEFDNDYDFKNWFGTPLKLLVKFKKAMDEKPKENSSQKSQRNFVLIIDEINRGNISKIFGELITLLEKDKRLGEENEITVTLPYSQEKFGVPPNLYIIGTMNTADRSIGTIDYALRRRFKFVSLKSEKNVISMYDKYQGNTQAKAENLFENIEKFIESNINEDLDAEDLMVGHSYFLCETEDELKRRLEYEIIPLLWEYQKDGIITCDRQILKDKIAEWKVL